jgi:hypothetical protein
MSTTQELCEAEIRQLLTTREGMDEIKKMHEEITGIPTPPVTVMSALIPEVLDRLVQDTEVATMLKDFLPAPEVILTLAPQDVGERLLLFFKDLILKKQHRNAINRKYIGSRYPVQNYPNGLQIRITKILLEGWDWLANQGLILQEGESFHISRNGEAYLKKIKEKEDRFVIFYSWQSDLPRSRNQDFIDECINEAIAKFSGGLGVEVVPSIDRDTQGEPGSPAIADTILAKIDNCDMFVCDVSIINNDENPKRPTPNPNVLLELGWAAKRLGWKRITSVFNLAYGKIQDLPFDLKQRRVVDYSLKSGENKKAAMKLLVDALVLQITAVIAMRQ